MKIALLLRGITYARGYVHHGGKTVRNICYKNTLDSVLENVIAPLRNVHETDVYLATYCSKLQDVVMKDFSPVSGVVFLRKGSQMDCMLQGLQKIKASSQCIYDVVIVCRFDLLLKCPITAIPFVHHKTNFLWHETTLGAIADCIHMFPYKHMDAWIHALETCPTRTSIHYIIPHLNILESDIHVVLKEPVESNTDKCCNPYYTIYRSAPVFKRKHA